MTSERTRRLIERILDEAELAREQDDWATVASLAADVVSLDAENAEAKALQSLSARKLAGEEERSRDEYVKRRRMTVLFCDLVGSTAMAEGRDPEIVRDILLSYQDACHQAMTRFEGHVAKYLGDGLMVFFGFPTAHEDDARRAVHAGLATVDAVAELAPSIARDYGVDLQVRVGVHTGLVVVAEMGSAPDVIGSTVNQTDRIQHQAAPGTVAVSDATAALIRGYFDLEPMGPVDLPGVEEPVELFTVLGATGAEERLEAAGTVISPFVGRDRERRKLAELWDVTRSEAAQGRPGRIVLLRGEAGIGKTRLGAWIRDLASRTGGAPIWGTTSPYFSSLPFHALTRMLRRRLGIEGHADDGSHLGRLEVELDQAGVDRASAVPLLAPLLGIAMTDEYTAPQLEPLELRARTLATFKRWWEGLAAKEPLVIAIEDLHWAEPTTLELLTQVALEAPPPGAMLVLTARPEFSADWEELPAVTVMEVEPLDEARRVELITAVSAAPLPDEVVTGIAERSDGVPLFIEELVRHAGDAADAIPDTLHELLLARLESSSAAELSLAQVAATIGREIDVDLTAAVTGMDGVAVRQGLASLAESGLLEARGFGPRLSYAFRHALIRDVAYDSQLVADAKATHSKVADAMVARAETGARLQPALVAMHLDRADRGAEAVGYYYLAGQASQATGAYSESVGQLTRGLALIDQLPDGEAKTLTELGIRTLLALAVTYTQGYGAEEAYDQYQQALTLADSLGDRPESLGVQLAILAYATIRGLRDDADRIVGQLQARLAAAPADQASLFDAEVLSVTALHDWVLGNNDATRRGFERALELFAARPDDAKVFPAWSIPNDPVVASDAQLITVRWVQGDRAAALEGAARALARCEELGFPNGPFSAAYTHGYMGYMHHIAGEHEAAAAEFATMLAIANDHGFAMWQAFANAQSIMSAAAVQPTDELLQGLSQLRQLLGTMGVQSFQPYFITAEGDIAWALRDAKAAVDLYDLAIERANATREFHYQPETYRKRGGARLDADAAAVVPAARDLATAAELAERQGAPLYQLRALRDLVERVPEQAWPVPARERLAALVEALGDRPDYPEIAEAGALVS